MSTHRKRVRHYDDSPCCHELTFSCYRRRPLLLNDDRPRMLSEAIDRATENHGWGLAAYVFMPEHVHLLVHPLRDGCRASPLLFAIKRPFSYRVKQRLIDTADPLIDELMVHQRPGVSTFRFWQEGPGYDRNLTSAKAIRSAVDYIHANPVRRGLCDRPIDWEWSSARWYDANGREQGPRPPRLTALPPEYWIQETILRRQSQD